MSGLTDKQFEMVCRLASSSLAGEDRFRIPALLEELLVAARRGISDQLKDGIGAHSDLEDAPGPHENPQVNELGPENGRAICHWDANVTQTGCELYIRPIKTTGGES